MTTRPYAWRRPWSREDLRTLREMRADGCLLAEIAEELGRSWYAVLGAVRKYGVPRPTPALLCYWLPLLRRPHCVAALAEEAGVSEGFVRNVKVDLRRRGLLNRRDAG